MSFPASDMYWLLCPVLHPTCTASDLSCIRTVLHQNCPASDLHSYCTLSDLSCIHPVLHLTCPASVLSCIRLVLHPVMHPSCPVSDLSCIQPVLHPSCTADLRMNVVLTLKNCLSLFLPELFGHYSKYFQNVFSLMQRIKGKTKFYILSRISTNIRIIHKNSCTWDECALWQATTAALASHLFRKSVNLLKP